MKSGRIFKTEPEPSLRTFACSSTCSSDKLMNGSTQQGDLWDPDSDCSSDDNNSPTALNRFRWSKPALEDKSLDFGWTSASDRTSTSLEQDGEDKRSRPLSNGYVSIIPEADDIIKCSEKKVNEVLKNECEEMQRNSSHITDQSFLDSRQSYFKHKLQESTEEIFQTNDSLLEKTSPSKLDQNGEWNIRNEEEDLRKAPWFQAGISREIALEVLSSKAEGSFIVRESTTKPGCYALSVKVPKGKNPNGIAHYLILNNSRGFKIKGFTKEFKSLDALITHHSVMPELLPCTLDLPRCHKENKSREKSRKQDMDFITTEKRCSVFSDIHWVMTDMKS